MRSPSTRYGDVVSPTDDENGDRYQPCELVGYVDRRGFQPVAHAPHDDLAERNRDAEQVQRPPSAVDEDRRDAAEESERGDEGPTSSGSGTYDPASQRWISRVESPSSYSASEEMTK